MSIAQSLLPEFNNEMANTRKMLERVPDDKLGYKPDPKSMTLGRLASHVAEIVGWAISVFNDNEYVITPGHKALDATSRAELLEALDQNVKEAHAAIDKAPDSGMMNKWALKFGDQEILAMPRAVVYRSMIMNHIIHHRAQLSVYFRLVGVPVPGMYGPSADEK